MWKTCCTSAASTSATRRSAIGGTDLVRCRHGTYQPVVRLRLPSDVKSRQFGGCAQSANTREIAPGQDQEWEATMGKREMAGGDLDRRGALKVGAGGVALAAMGGLSSPVWGQDRVSRFGEYDGFSPEA